MDKRLTIYLAALGVATCGTGFAARGDLQATPTPIIIKPAEGIPSEATPTPTPLLTQEPPENFDPSAFGTITTETLPRENGEPLVMRVNGRPVTWADFEIQAKLAGAALIEANPGSEAGVYAALKEPVMDLLIAQELFREYTEVNRLDIHPSEVKRQLHSMETSANPAVRESLARLEDDEREAFVRDTLTREKVIKFIGDRATSAPPSMDELRKFVSETNPTTSPMQLNRASHIVLRATPDMTEFNINDAKARAEEVLQKIRNGLDFETAARQFSQDRFTSYQGGNIGYFSPGTMYEAFDEAAGNLKRGEVSDIVRTPVGFHIIKITERHDDDLRLLYDIHRRSMATQQWLQEAGDKAQVERYLGK